ncbi:Mfs multidrug transporter [Favolaschia claudopus]|uniref:Mfs multidrug transporter n=1 Tax=Favolaschia claudopus TaxID=2862362 RepID=A0AAV9Z6D7_9AGAR
MAEETAPLLTAQPHVDYGNNSRDAESAAESLKSKASLPAIVIPMAFGIFIVAIDQTIVVSSFAAIGSELNQLQNTSWIATAYMMTLTSFQPLYGKMSDIFGRKPCLLFAYAVFGLGCFLCGCARTLPELIAARAIAGVGGGGMTTVVSIIMSDIVPLRSRGTWQGIINVIFAVGSASGAPLGGILVDTVGWRWGFLIQVPALILAFASVTSSLHLPPTSSSTSHSSSSTLKTKLARVDFPGALSLVLTVFFLLFTLDRGGNIAWNDTYTLLTLGLFLLFFTVFLLVELTYAAEPFAPKRIIAHRSLIFAYLANAFGFMSSFSMVFHVSLFYQAVLRAPPSEAGLWLLPTVFSGVLGSLAGGLWIQATGKYYWATVLSYGALFLGNILTVLEAGVLQTSAIGVAAATFVYSIGNGGGVTTSLIALIANAGPADQAMATAVSYLFRSLGSVVGVSLGSTVLQLSLRSALHKSLPPDVDIDDIIARVRSSLSAIDELEPATAAIVRMGYEGAVQNAMWSSTAAAGCAFVCGIFIKEKVIHVGSGEQSTEGVEVEQEEENGTGSGRTD